MSAARADMESLVSSPPASKRAAPGLYLSKYQTSSLLNIFLTLIILVSLQPNDALRYGPLQNESVGSLVQNAGKSTTRYSHKGFLFLLQFLFTVMLFIYLLFNVILSKEKFKFKLLV